MVKYTVSQKNPKTYFDYRLYHCDSTTAVFQLGVWESPLQLFVCKLLDFTLHIYGLEQIVRQLEFREENSSQRKSVSTTTKSRDNRA